MRKTLEAVVGSFALPAADKLQVLREVAESVHRSPAIKVQRESRAKQNPEKANAF